MKTLANISTFESLMWGGGNSSLNSVFNGFFADRLRDYKKRRALKKATYPYPPLRNPDFIGDTDGNLWENPRVKEDTLRMHRLMAGEQRVHVPLKAYLHFLRRTCAVLDKAKNDWYLYKIPINLSGLIVRLEGIEVVTKEAISSLRALRRIQH